MIPRGSLLGELLARDPERLPDGTLRPTAEDIGTVFGIRIVADPSVLPGTFHLRTAVPEERTSASMRVVLAGGRRLFGFGGPF